MSWKPTTFKLTLNPRAAQEPGDDGTRSGVSDGVFTIHRPNRLCWNLSHAASGFKVKDCRTRSECKVLVQRLYYLPIDWSSAEPLKAVSESVRNQFRNMVRGSE